MVRMSQSSKVGRSETQNELEKSRNYPRSRGAQQSVVIIIDGEEESP